MLSINRAAAATASFAIALALAGCGSTTPATPPAATFGATAPAGTLAAATPVTPTPGSSATAAAATLVATPQTSAVPSAPASAQASAQASPAPRTPPAPVGSLDPASSDAGVVGQITIPDDTRDPNANRSGTSQIVGVEADGSNCSDSLDGTEFTAVAWYDAATNGMLHQMAVSVPTDTVPANDGEIRAGITNGAVYADFISESGSGTAYSGDASDQDSGSSTIDVTLTGGTLVFTYAGTTWDGIDFSGQMMCAGMGG